MEFKYVEKPIPHIIVHDFFSNQEVEDIWKELQFLTNNRTLVNEQKTESALDENGNPLKKNSGVFLDSFYGVNRNSSHILTYNRKIWNKDFIKRVEQCNDIFKYIGMTNQDSCLLSYYEDNDHYPPHVDISLYTMLIHLYREPKQFQGGEFSLHGVPDVTYDNCSNRMILFPSFQQHSVNKIIMSDNKKFSGNGRYTISQFFGLTIFK
jgi:Rps23 Pro-64 3,4-dihydroxylase Tpa1-like proline 4-hydroxylase